MRFHRPQGGGLLASAAILTAAITAVAVALLLMAGSGRGTAEAYTLSGPSSLGAGQTLTLNNEAVQLDFISQSAGYNNEFGRALPGPTTSYFFCHSGPSGIIDGGRFSGPQELRFYLTTPAQGSPSIPRTFYTGPGSNNSDGFPHARMTTIATNTVRLEWEDLLGGGDQDWNDCVIDIIITPLASLTVCKDVRGNDSGATSWTMDINGPDALSDRTDILADGGCATEDTLSPGSYTLTEMTPPPGYVTSIDCGSKGSSASNAITFSLAGGESPVCTVYNDTTANFQVFKDFVPDDPQDVNVSLACTSGTVTINDVNTSESDPADFTVDQFSLGATCTATETAPTGYTNVSNCTAVPISPGGTATCTFTNTSTAFIQFCKDVVPDDASTWVATLTGPTGGVSPAVGDGGCHTFTTLAPGSYTLTESGPGGYSPSFSCTNGNTGLAGSTTFTLGAGEQVTCTFTNTGFGSIQVCKTVVINDGSSWNYAVSGPTPGNGTLTSGQCQTLPSRAPGNYTVSETVPGAGYQPSYNCGSKGSGNGGGVSFNLDPGENVTCTFTNNLTAFIRVCKSVVPADATLWVFTLTGPAGGGATIGNGQCSTFNNRPAGSYTVGEASQSGYASSYSCDNGKGSGSGTSNTFSLGLGEQVTCNFTNAQFGSMAIVKDAVPDDAQDFSFTCTGPLGNFQLDDDADGTLPNAASASVAPGTYTCSETQENGWQISVSCNDSDSTGSGGTATIIVAPAENVTCTFMNSFVQGEPIAVGGIVGLIDGISADGSAAASGGRSASPLITVLLGGLLAGAGAGAWFARRRVI